MQFRPGALGVFWTRLSDENAANVAAGGLIGTFTTAVGELHKLIVYRSVKENTNLRITGWEALLHDCREFIVARNVSVYEPGPLAELSPLWGSERFDG